MKKTHWRLMKIIFFLFLANSVYMLLYFTSDHHHHNTVTVNHSIVPENHRMSTLKPWPILPSYLPWSDNQKVELRSCEAFFGNGFNQRVDLLPPSSGGGWFRCFFSKTLGSSICEGGKLRMIMEKIKMSRGGERLEEVVGRGEEDELPEFSNGAFEVLGLGQESKKRRRLVTEETLDQYVPEGQIMRHTMRELLRSVHVVEDKDFHCDEWIEEPTLLVTRFEYANLFHTITDWYSAYVSSRVTGLPHRPHLVFLDGHCQAPLEETWKSLFSRIRYAKHFSGSVCFRHAIFSPLGYETALFKGLTEEINCEGESAHNLFQNPNDKKTARLSEFGEMIRSSFGFSINRPRIVNPTSGLNILFVRREDYLAHPRHRGKIESRLSNEREVFGYLQNWASNYSECKLNIVNGLFAHKSMKEQVRAIQDANVIIGAHGAGLTHIVSALPKTVVLEIISSQFRRPHFRLIAKWKGLDYHAIDLHGSYASPAMVIKRLRKILNDLGC